jgi:hypothetical protein
VRGHAAWALGEIGGAQTALREAIDGELDPWCLEEMEMALAGGNVDPPVG